MKNNNKRIALILLLATIVAITLYLSLTNLQPQSLGTEQAKNLVSTNALIGGKD